MRILVVGAAALLGSQVARAAPPAADVVIVWAPDADPAPVTKVAQELGIAVIDKTPAPPPAQLVAPLVQRGIDAYNAVQFDIAWQSLERARDLIEHNGAAGLAPSQLGDLFLYRSLLLVERKEPALAWEEIVTSVVVDPTRVLDPTRFPPRVIDDHARARAGAEAHKGTVSIDVPPSCTTWIDGRAYEPSQALLAGSHFANVRCEGRTAWAQRITVTDGGVQLRELPLLRVAPPTDAEILVQARSASVKGVIVAEVHDRVGLARLLGIDGKERARRSVGLTNGDLTPLAEAIRGLARTSEPQKHWYESRWALAGGAALLAAAIVIPITVVLASDNTPSSGTIRGPGALP